jgi:pimeloyl-ACP methyl ester carboxylesterase
MPYAQSSGARIYYETRGDENGIPALFIEGFSVQMIGWREALLEQFVANGVRVVIFDNRDVGLSQQFGGAGDFDGGYSLEDMAMDGFAVLDALGLESAHVVGQSMGGMIAQLMALRDPRRVRSLVLFYTAPGTGYLRSRTQEAAANPANLYVHRPRDEAIAALIERERMSQSSAYPFDDTWVREWATRSYERGYAPAGVARQAAAIGRLPPQIAGLEALELPAVVIHGRDDRLIDPAAALELARRLPKSELHLYPGLGHELAKPLWSEWVAMIGRSFAAAPP